MVEREKRLVSASRRRKSLTDGQGGNKKSKICKRPQRKGDNPFRLLKKEPLSFVNKRIRGRSKKKGEKEGGVGVS